ncbi:MAG: hypothetical protein LBU34_01170 [Planctomycetaceae bacterium]|nr:hypothetical protein [Planctomycetaceae bacterium]
MHMTPLAGLRFRVNTENKSLNRYDYFMAFVSIIRGSSSKFPLVFFSKGQIIKINRKLFVPVGKNQT